MLPAAAAGCALIYSPANLAPLASRRNVVVIHDVAALRHPEAYSPAYVRYQRAMLPALARRARGVITVSEFSRGELVEVLGVSPDRITVIPEGVGERFRPDADRAAANGRYALDRPYVLAVGTVSERKNLALLARAAQALRGRGIELVLAGSDRGYLRGAGGADQAARLRPRRAAPRAVRGGPGARDAVTLRGVRTAVPRGDGVRDAGRRRRSRGAAGDGRRRRAARRPRRSRRVRRGADRGGVRAATRERLVDAGLRRAAGYSWTRTAELTDATIGALLCSGGRA